MGLELAPDIRGRVQKQKATERQMLSSGEREWGISLGSYADDRIAYGHFREPVEFGKFRLENYELFVHDQIPNLLANNRGDQPVILLDIGGGAGNSWSKLALAYEEEVRSGKLAFVVSNLASTPEQQLENHSHNRRLTRSEKDILEEVRAKNLVHFVTGNLNQLRQESITLPNGQTLPLRDNVNFVNEELSVTAWSHTPDLDILKIGRLISPSSGIYVARRTKDTCASYDQEYSNNVSRGIDLAQKGLQQDHGLIKVAYAQAGELEGHPLDRYTIFKTPQAPPIELN